MAELPQMITPRAGVLLPAHTVPSQLKRWDGWVIHWPGDNRSHSDADPVETWRATQRYHFQRGWTDIAYHFGVGLDGRIFEGRPIGRQGAATYGHNDSTMAVCVLAGPGESSAEAIYSARWLIHHHVSALGWRVGRIWPHSGLRPTACPGHALRSALGEIALPIPTIPEVVPIMANEITLDIVGVAHYIDECYRLAGRPDNEDLEGRLYWLTTALETDYPLTTLATMRLLLGLKW